MLCSCTIYCIIFDRMFQQNVATLLVQARIVERKGEVIAAAASQICSSKYCYKVTITFSLLSSYRISISFRLIWLFSLKSSKKSVVMRRYFADNERQNINMIQQVLNLSIRLKNSVFLRDRFNNDSGAD